MKYSFSVRFAFFFLGILVVGAIFAPYWVKDPNLQDVSVTLQGPAISHPLGLDGLGRDLLSRIIYGARISLCVGAVSAVFSLVIGAVIGALSGYLGSTWDQAISRIIDIFYSIPALLIVILIKEVIEQGDPQRGLWAIILALSLYSWMHVARIVRGEILRLKTLPYAEAARALGFSHPRILFLHLLPNTWGPLLVTLTLRIPLAILSESMLGFIGLGVKSPMASWGTLASEGYSAMRFHPHLIFFPSLVLFLTVLSMNLIGEALRDRFDPALRV